LKKATRKKTTRKKAASRAAAPPPAPPPSPPSPIEGVDVGQFLTEVGKVAGKQHQGGDVVALIAARGVTDQDSADLMGEASQACKGLARQAETEFAAVVGLAHKLHRALTGMRGKFTKPLVDAARTADNKISQWIAVENRRRQEEANTARLLAEKQEKKRVAAAAIQLSRANPTLEPKEAADLARETYEAPPVYAPEPVKVAGKSISTPYVAEVVSKMGVYRAIAAGKIPAQCAEIKQGELNRYAQSHGPTGAIPGTLNIARRATIRGKA